MGDTSPVKYQRYWNNYMKSNIENEILKPLGTLH